MPQGKHVRGASSKQERQYEHIKKSAQKSGRYGKRAKEVAARTVNKMKSEGKTGGGKKSSSSSSKKSSSSSSHKKSSSHKSSGRSSSKS